MNHSLCKIKRAALLSIGFLAASATALRAADGPMGVERVARDTHVGYEAPAPSEGAPLWVQVDLGQSQRIDAVKLLPVIDWGPSSHGFPARFQIHASDDPQFKTSTLIADHSAADFPAPRDEIGVFRTRNLSGRYVRLTATSLREGKLSLCKFEVWSAGRDVAQGRPSRDSVRGDLGVTPLTRTPRPQGERVVTDNPGNVTAASTWRPVRYRATAPVGGVTLGDGLFKSAMQDNIKYLMGTFTQDELVRQFRERAGLPEKPGMRAPDSFWESALAGSNAGRFLMGAGNTLRWMPDATLRQRLDAVVDTIEECREPSGYIMAYPADEIFQSERAAYTRSWVTHGLIEAGYAGNPKAFGLLRGFYDWFDKNPYLPELLRRGGQGVQGMIANARMYSTPVGKPEDLQAIQRYFQENYWLDQLAHRDPSAIWKYPYDHPHNYLITSLEPYLDLYRATGSPKYLEAARGGWELYHDDWEHIGGSIAICEGEAYPPGSRFLHRHTGELCGSVFWARYNQRFHLLQPEQEKYVAEIEKSIYNVLLPNQIGSQGILYHANLLGQKDKGSGFNKNTCCEGQGTRMLGSLPEYIFSTAPDGLFVDLFAPSQITWKQGSKSLKLAMQTRFPLANEVALRFSLAAPTRSRIRLRVPSWASAAMPILVNGKVVATGRPSTYVSLNRTWKDGDAISFRLPATLRLEKYQGAEERESQPRYAVQYGPILMAAVGAAGAERPEARFATDASSFARGLGAQPNQPLRFAVAGHEDYEFVPYWQVAMGQTFTCFPVIGAADAPDEKVSADDLALASRGASATSDSEYSQEPGGTAKVIDGVIAHEDDFANRWHSSNTAPHPHWIEVRLPRPRKLGRVIVHFADPQGHATHFRGVARVGGRDRILFEEKGFRGRRRYEADLKGLTADAFRLVILQSANPEFPNAAQVSEIEILPAP